MKNLDCKGEEKETGTISLVRPVSQMVEFYISGHIGPAENYVAIFNQIRNLGELDFVKLHINSYGGDLFTAIQFMRVLQESSATVICSVEGACFSAATLIFLCGNEYEISHHSAFMFHNYSGLAIGKGGEMIDQLLHERKWSEKLLREAYADFLTDDEILSLLENKDIWMEAAEVVTRLEKKSKVRKGPCEAEKAVKKRGKVKDPTAK
jgi:ATP-dependent protease ClpP protease subunit